VLGSFLVLIEEIIDEDSYPPEGMSKPNRGVADDDAYNYAYFDNSFCKGDLGRLRNHYSG
jgi:hypothetical protein